METFNPESHVMADPLKIENNVRAILQSLGEDVDREGLIETPHRYIKFLTEFTEKEAFKLTTFDAEEYTGPVIKTGIRFYSLCEHHMLPFFGFASIAYIPKDKILGLSKLSRIVDHFSRRLQNQERITKQIADFIENELSPAGIAVRLKAQHMCVMMRGVEKHESWTTTMDHRGNFQDNPVIRENFIREAMEGEQ